MKIAIQGKIIDTENIYSISSEIFETYDPNRKNTLVHAFEIESFDNKILLITSTYPNIQELTETTQELYKQKLEKMRQDVINIWSNNQTTIPSFNIENY